MYVLLTISYTLWSHPTIPTVCISLLINMMEVSALVRHLAVEVRVSEGDGKTSVGRGQLFCFRDIQWHWL
jgi:hypothetical protein